MKSTNGVHWVECMKNKCAYIYGHCGDIASNPRESCKTH